MPFDPASFTGIKLNTWDESSCTPAVDGDFRGLVIATPNTVDLSSPWHEAVGSNRPRPVLPVCGTIQFAAATGARFLSITDQILLVAVDIRSHIPFVSTLVEKFLTPEISPRPTPEQLDEWRNRVETAFFNANAFDYLEDLPAAPGRYHIFAMVGDIVSNLRTVEVVGEGTEKPSRKIAPGEALFGARATAPSVPPEFRGVRIKSRVQRWPKDGGPVWIDGLAQLATDDARALGVKPIQKALVVTVSSGLMYRTWNPAGEQALFVDDQEKQAQVVRGPFSLDLSQAFGPSRGEGVYVMVSAGSTLSNVIFIPPG